jgi:hypothetical protein
MDSKAVRTSEPFVEAAEQFIAEHDELLELLAQGPHREEFDQAE